MTPTAREPAQGEPSTRRSAAYGILFARGRGRDVLAWAAKGVVPVAVAPLGGRTVLVPRGRSAAGPPYDDAAMLCAARPAPLRLTPTLGCWAIGGRAVLTVQLRHWRRTVRWVVWDPEQGVLRPPGLEMATPRQVVAAAGGGERCELTEMLAERRHQPVRLLGGVLAVLGLPGATLLTDPGAADTMPGAALHVPDPQQVAYFEDAVRDSLLLRHELGADV